MTPKGAFRTGNEVPATTAAAELKYERCTNAVEMLAKDEHIRVLRLRVLSLQGQVDDLNEMMWKETERGDEAEANIETWQASAEKANKDLERTLNQLRLRTREMDIIKTEISSLQAGAIDSTQILTEKLALNHELAKLKPELDNLRSQSSCNENLLAEKLSLECQLRVMQAERDTERHSLRQAMAKQDEKSEQNTEYLTEIERYRIELSKAKVDLVRALKAAAKADAVDELKADLARERQGREMAEKNADKSEEVYKLRQELAKEKREREKAIKNLEGDLDAQKAILEDKLNQCRTKLTTIKGKLKDTEGELLQARALATAPLPPPTDTRGKNSRKRRIAQIDPDIATGTPGDAAPSKRGKRASSVVGEKSTFSITPFLNRTMSVAPESSPKHVSDDVEDEPVATIEGTGSSTSKRAKPALSTRKPLGMASAAKTNTKADRKGAAVASTLELVAEENDSDAENAPTPAEAEKKEKLALKPTLKPKPLASYASFRDASLPLHQQVKKKRKLLGGSARTIFDDKEDKDGADFGVGRAAFGVQRAFGTIWGRGFGGLGLLGGMKKKGSLVVGEDGFTFSPLKSDRKTAAAAAAWGGMKT